MEDGGEAGGQRDEVGWGTPSPRRSPPGSQTHTFPGSQFVCLQKKLFFKACSHLPEENMSFKKKTETKKQNKTTLTLTDRSVFWRKALCFYLIRATALSGKTALSSTCFINSQLFILLLPGKMTNIFPFTHCSPFHSSDKYRTYFI